MHEATRLAWCREHLAERLAGAQAELVAAMEGRPGALAAAARVLGRLGLALDLLQIRGGALLAHEMAATAAAGAEEGGHRDSGLLLAALWRLQALLGPAPRTEAPPPLALIRLVDDLRARRGAPLLSAAALPLPEPDLPPAWRAPARGLPDARLRRLRARYQQGLVAWYRGRDAGGAMGAAVGELRPAVSGTPAAALWWLAAALLEGLDADAVAGGPAMERLLAALDGELRSLAAGASPAAPDPRLLRSLVTHACGDGTHRAGRELAEACGLEALLPGEGGGEAGAWIPYLEAISEEVREDVASVSGLLAELQEAGGGAAAAQARLPAFLERFADVLGLLGMGALWRRHRPADAAAGPSVLVDALVAVEGALLGAVNAGFEELLDGAAALGAVGRLRDSAPEAAAALGAEARREVAALRGHVRRHLAAPAAGIPAWAAGRSLARLRGAAAVAVLGGAARAFHALGRYLDEALDARSAPALAEGLDDWLEAVEGLALYLDAVLGGRSDAAGLLAGAQACVARLPLGPEMAVEEAAPDRVEEVDLAAPPREAPPAAEGGVTELEATLEEIVLATPDPAQPPLPPALAASLAAARERFARLEAAAQPRDPAPAADGPPDREVSAVYREEVAAIAQSLQEALAAWEREPDAPGPPRRAARALRTLRSASRLAGAVALGDMAWACARLAEGPPKAGGGEALRATLREVQALLPAFAAAFAAGEEPPEAAALAARLGEEARSAGRG